MYCQSYIAACHNSSGNKMCFVPLYADNKILIDEDSISILIQLYTMVEELASLILNEWVARGHLWPYELKRNWKLASSEVQTGKKKKITNN